MAQRFHHRDDADGIIGGVMGVKKTATFCAIIVVLSTMAGMIYGTIFSFT